MPIFGNKTQIYQVFQNLINNGIKYQSPDASPHIQISMTDTDTHWEISIQDNGIGIAEKYIDQIFEVFKRLHRKDEYPGTGIGLSICKKVVERHGGSIRVKSTPGKGSTFYFTILKPNSTEDT